MQPSSLLSKKKKINCKDMIERIYQLLKCYKECIDLACSGKGQNVSNISVES